MEPKLRIIESFIVEGLKTRTSNQAELNILTSKIPTLWTNFSTEVYTPLILNNDSSKIEVYGVYFNFDKEPNGYYDLVAGIKELDNSQHKLQNIEIKHGDYLVFTSEGQIPQAVISCWMKVWKYFSNESVQYERLFQTDFEKYLSANKVEIHVGVRKK